MSDFWQGSVSTLHLLQGDGDAMHLEAPLREYTAARPLTVIIPCHSRDMVSDSFRQIIHVLSNADWVQRVVVGLDAADQEQYQQAGAMLAPLGQRAVLLWWKSVEWEAAMAELKTEIPTLPEAGKGRNVWLCMGWLYQQQTNGVVALLDADVRNFTASMLARLVYPVVRPDLGYTFAKAYYARFTTELHGRLTRLLVIPLIEAWEEIHKSSPLSTFFRAFRYPLAGEMAMSADLLAEMKFPAGYGMEMGILSHVYETLQGNSICQTGICSAHDHHHQSLHGPDGKSGGLQAAATEVAATLYALLGTTPKTQTAMETAYRLRVCRALHHALTDAAINGLEYSLEQESKTARMLGKMLPTAPLQEITWLPSWKSLSIALPKFFH